MNENKNFQGSKLFGDHESLPIDFSLKKESLIESNQNSLILLESDDESLTCSININLEKKSPQRRIAEIKLSEISQRNHLLCLKKQKTKLNLIDKCKWEAVPRGSVVLPCIGDNKFDQRVLSQTSLAEVFNKKRSSTMFNRESTEKVIIYKRKATTDRDYSQVVQRKLTEFLNCSVKPAKRLSEGNNCDPAKNKQTSSSVLFPSLMKQPKVLENIFNSDNSKRICRLKGLGKAHSFQMIALERQIERSKSRLSLALQQKEFN